MRHALRLMIAAVLAAPALAHAQATVQLQLGLPVVMPQVVVVSPGVQVVPDVDEEIFYVNGWYWVRQDGGWYRSHSPRRGWFFVAPERVPTRLVHIPPGQYCRWHPQPAPRPQPARFRPPPPAPRPAAGIWGGAVPVRREGPGHGGPGRGHDGDGRGHGRGEHRGHGDRD